VHHPIAWYCFVFANVLMWAWGVADCLHVVRHPGERSASQIVCRWIVLLVFLDLGLIALFVFIAGIVGLG
jgi:hypothetical protein